MQEKVVVPNSAGSETLKGASFSESLRRHLLAPALIAAGLGLGYGTYRTIQGTQFMDLPGPSKHEFGRTVNGLSALIAAHVANKISPNCAFSMTIEKPWFADANIYGSSSNNEIKSSVELTFTGCTLTASGSPGAMKGTVDKSEFDWNIKQTGTEKWDIERFLLKFDTSLDLQVHNGKITGSFNKTLDFDWSINGTYDEKGNVDITVKTAWLYPNFKIVGKVTPK